MFIFISLSCRCCLPFVPFRGCVFALAAKRCKSFLAITRCFYTKKGRDYSRPSCGSHIHPSFCRHDKAPTVNGHILLIVLLLGRDQGAAPQTVRALAAVFTACATCGLFTDMKMFCGLFGSGPTPCQALLSETSPSKIIRAPSVVYRIISGD